MSAWNLRQNFLYRKKLKDALHIAAAIYSRCGYFITTDRKILNKKIDGIALVSPLTFLEEYTE
jgi:predicted nucleic acid-binding protein